MSAMELFLKTITPDIFDASDFVDWDTIDGKVRSLRREIALLESLDHKEPLEDLTDLLLKNPRILDVLQLLIAHTPSEIWFADGRRIKFKEDKVTLQQKTLYGTEPEARAKEIAQIFLDMGLLNFLSTVKSVKDVVRGVLIGLEPNVRKNRRGAKFEYIVDDLVENVTKEVSRKLNLKLRCEKSVRIDLEKERKKVDFAIFENDQPRVVVETNFYATAGSKPIETLTRAYPNLQRGLNGREMALIVITDGLGWRSMQSAVSTMLGKLRYCFNLNQARKGALKEVFLQIFKR